jgi:hypothetical protein
MPLDGERRNTVGAGTREDRILNGSVTSRRRLDDLDVAIATMRSRDLGAFANHELNT